MLYFSKHGLYTQYQRIKNVNFVVERPRIGLILNSFRYLGHKLSSVPENFKKLKKDQLKQS